MSAQDRHISAVLILADESADWTVAGLRQRERLLLLLNECFKGERQVAVCVWPNSDALGFATDRALPNLLPTTEITSGDGDVLVLNTRVVTDPEGLGVIVDLARAGRGAPALILAAADIRGTDQSSLAKRIDGRRHERGNYVYLDKPEMIDLAEKKLLSQTAKSQDGLVSRFVNRPISRTLSRVLVRLPLHPNQWTLWTMVFPLIGAILILRGDYFGFALGAVLFQLHGVLDGCDGEIARAKFLQSASGRKLDQLCDRFATLLYAVTLGFGLSRETGLTEAWRWFYPLEGIVAALLIGVGETLLTRSTIDEELAKITTEDNSYPDYVKVHRGSFNEGDQLKLWMIKHSGMLGLGERAASFFSHATKRDVFNFGFMLLALCGLPSWILHILAAVACAVMILSVKNLFVSDS